MDFKPASFSADDVLQVLEEQMRWFYALNFEMLEEYTALAGGRLSVFRSHDGRLWAVAIEVIYYDARAESHTLAVHLLSNCLRPPTEGRPARERVLFVVPPDAALPDEHEFYGSIPRDEFTILRYGRRQTFRPTPDDYARAGLRWTAAEEESGAMSPQDMLRFLCARLGASLFASEDTLRDALAEAQDAIAWDADGHAHFCGYQYNFDEVPYPAHDLELLIQAHEWTHPNWAFEDADTRGLVPQIEAMRPLAEAIVSGNLSAWNAQDPSVFNAHWRFWADRTIENEERQHQQHAAMAASVMETCVAGLDNALQVLAPSDLAAFEEDARHRLATENAIAVEAQGRGATFYLMQWQFGEHSVVANPTVLREWLRRRANRSSSEA